MKLHINQKYVYLNNGNTEKFSIIGKQVNTKVQLHWKYTKTAKLGIRDPKQRTEREIM